MYHMPTVKVFGATRPPDISLQHIPNRPSTIDAGRKEHTMKPQQTARSMSTEEMFAALEAEDCEKLTWRDLFVTTGLTAAIVGGCGVVHLLANAGAW